MLLIFLSGCTKKQIPVSECITIAAVGDVNFGSDYPVRCFPPGNGSDFFKECRKILQSADISFCNLETVLCDGGSPAKNMDGKSTFVFRVSPSFANILSGAGFDVVSIANNHIRDFGVYGEKETKNFLKQNGIQFVSKDGSVASFTLRGTKVHFVGFSSGYERRSITSCSVIF